MTEKEIIKAVKNLSTGATNACVFMSAMCLVLICLIFAMQASMPKPTFYIYDRFKNTRQITPRFEPNVTPTALLDWAALAATSIHTLNFVNYQNAIDSHRGYFTNEGYEQYLGSINSSGFLDRVISDKLSVSAVVTDTPVILQEGPMRGLYIWRIQVPLLVTYQGSSLDSTETNLAVNLLITKVPTENASKGIGIAQIVVNAYSPRNTRR